MDTILVLCQSRRQSALIARTLRYRQVYSLPLALDSRAETVLSHAPKGIVLSANDGVEDALAQVDPALLAAGGVCGASRLPETFGKNCWHA